jgi:hypothetical protein
MTTLLLYINIVSYLSERRLPDAGWLRERVPGPRIAAIIKAGIGPAALPT